MHQNIECDIIVEKVACTLAIEAFNLFFNLLTLKEPKALMVCIKILSGYKL
jgi:hypothetical protein